MKHTPEPWAVYAPCDRFPGIEAPETATSVVIYGVEDEDCGVRGDTPEIALANAERIVACINACAGLNPEAVPLMVKALERVKAGLCYPDEYREVATEALAKLKAPTP